MIPIKLHSLHVQPPYNMLTTRVLIEKIIQRMTFSIQNVFGLRLRLQARKFWATREERLPKRESSGRLRRRERKRPSPYRWKETAFLSLNRLKSAVETGSTVLQTDRSTLCF